MPGFTHLQPAQPVTFGHHLMAYVEMFARDRSRFSDARRRLNECPLGAAALAGTSFAIDRHMTAQALGFERPTANSLDSVADRDFVLGRCRGDHHGRPPVALCRGDRAVDDAAVRLHPPLRRADDRLLHHAAEAQPRRRRAVRAKVGRIAGAFQGLVLVMKGLPLAYSKDMQEDKEATFDAFSARSRSPR